MGLLKNLQIGINVPAEVSVNISVEDGLTNGASCVVKKLDYRIENSKRCSIIWLQFDEADIGMQWKCKYNSLYETDILREWIPILETTRRFNIQYYKTYSVVRRQFPLRIAAAKTIHKSQGSTMSAAVVHFINI